MLRLGEEGIDVGRIVGLWRYPVKSFAGESVTEVVVDERGVLNDRVWALVNGDGKMASGKTTRRFRSVKGLLRNSARIGDEDTLMLHLVDGRVVEPSDAIAEELAGPGWRFRRESAISHLDAGPIHLVTTASLASLGAAAGMPIEPERLRPNIVIDAGGTRDEELAGKRLTLGEVGLKVTGPTERCVMVGHEQTVLPKRGELLRTIGQWNDLCIGMYASVERPGRMRVSDPVYLL